MCIRDSSAAVRAEDAAIFTYGVMTAFTRNDVRSHVAVDIACLLYTSDAADERSSVDLGGRRIIKKKKHENQTTRNMIQYVHDSNVYSGD